MSSPDRDSRRDKRVTFTMHARLATASSGEGIIHDASVIDLSESGVRVRFTGVIMPGETVGIFLNKRPEPCRVVWTKPAGASEELIAGLEFLCPLPEPRSRPTPPEGSFEPVN